MKTEYKTAVPVPIEELTPYSLNAKTHDDKQIRNIAQSIKQFGFTQPLVIDKDGVVIIGHGRLLAAKQLGLAEVPCIRREDLSEEEIRELRLLDNKLNESPWDVELLAADLEGLDFSGYDLDFDTPEELEPVDVQEDNWAPDLDTETEIQPGEIWALGDHRLMCGDSTNPENIKKLAGGVANIDLLLTDPPYNVDYTGKTKDSLKIKNDKMAEDDFERFLVAAFRAADSVMRPGAAFYIWHAPGPIALNFMTAAKQVWPIRQTLIWVKNTMVLGHSDYHYKHEPCLYGWKGGADRFFAPTRRETTVVEDQIDPDKMSKKELKDFVRQMLTEDQIDTTVLHEDKPTRSELHPTMKPVKLMARLIRNSSQEGDAILDPFGGSGSTLIACEQMNRRCFTAELDPKYARTIIDRWEAFTGKKAVRT